MNKAIKERWVSALRSGEYKKGKGRLRSTNNGYCCLGVLTELYLKEHPKSKGKWRNTGNGFSSFGRDDVTPVPVMRWAGLRDSNPMVAVSDDTSLSLAELNDGDGYKMKRARSFREIADTIEAKL